MKQLGWERWQGGNRLEGNFQHGLELNWALTPGGVRLLSSPAGSMP